MDDILYVLEDNDFIEFRLIDEINNISIVQDTNTGLKFQLKFLVKSTPDNTYKDSGYYMRMHRWNSWFKVILCNKDKIIMYE